MKVVCGFTHFIVSPTPLCIANRQLAHKSLQSQANIGNPITGVGAFDFSTGIFLGERGSLFSFDREWPDECI